jgi:xanthine dehydrogenase accessory factor
MGETSHILSLWRRARARGEAVCVATVVHVEGSSYRKPGARMLLTAGGERAGSISGGCLEGEISKKAWWLTADGPSIQRYQSSFEEDSGGIPWGLGCGGTLWVLLERDAEQVLSALEAAQERGEPALVLTRLRLGLAVSHSVGTVDVLSPASARLPKRGAGIETPAVERALREKRSLSIAGESTATEADSELPEWFLEYLAPPPRLTIFGAGDDAQPIARFAQELDWRVCVADGRANLLRPERFPEGTALQLLHYYENALAPACGTPAASETATPIPTVELEVLAGEFAVILTHSWEQDRSLLRALLPADLAYLGILGPRHRTLSLLEQVGPALGWSLDKCWAALHSPVGLDLGARDPASIALSIMAELQATAAARSVTVSRRQPVAAHG